jgi:hypothetical protein
MPSKLKLLMQKFSKNRWVFRLIGLAVFVLILAKIDLKEALAVLAKTNIWFVILSIVLQGVALLVTTYRWQLIMRRLDIHIPYIDSVQHQLIGTAAAVVTPGQIGEFVKVLYHKKYGYPYSTSLASVIVDRLFDLLMLLSFGGIALATLIGIPTPYTILLTCLGVAVVISALLLSRWKDRGAPRVAALLARLSPVKYRQIVLDDTERLTRRLGEFSPLFLLSCALLSVFNYALLVYRIYVLVLALHIQVPFLYFAMVVPLMRLVGLLPISISGIGTREVTVIYLLNKVGVPAEASLVLSLLGLITLQFQALVGLLVGWKSLTHTFWNTAEPGDQSGLYPSEQATPTTAVKSAR